MTISPISATSPDLIRSISKAGAVPAPAAEPVPAPAPAPTPKGTPEPAPLAAPAEPSEVSATAPNPAVSPTPVDQKPGKAKGVLRLLSAGHFRGVAELRLRMKFEGPLGKVVLPELSPPKGHGKAYAKFLAAYEGQGGPRLSATA